MGFEAAVSLETKLDTIQRLVDGGVLTKTDYELCKRALTKKEPSANWVYRDKFMAAFFKGFGKNRFMEDQGILLNMILENRTDDPISIYATISVNGIIVNLDHNCIRNLPAKSKIIAQVPLPYDKLDMLDVKKVEDMETLSFSFKCQDGHFKDLSKYSKPKKLVL